MNNEPNTVRKGMWPTVLVLGIIVLGCDFGIYGLWQVAKAVLGGH